MSTNGLDDRVDIPTWSWWAAPAAIVFGLILGSVGTIIVDAIGASGGGSVSHPTAIVSIFGDIVFDLCFVAAALIMVAASNGVAGQQLPRPSEFGFRRAHLVNAVVTFVIAAIIYYVVTDIYGIVFNLQGKDKLPSELSNTHNHAAIAMTAVFVCAVAPICEEFFFRGFLFGTLRKMRVMVAGHDLSVWIAAVITGILFGLVHTGSASSQFLIPLGFLGFMLCMVRWRTGSLYPGMAMHSANNALALGYEDLHWTAPEIIALMLGSWAVIALIVGPVGARVPPLQRGRAAAS
ncbi:MAG: CPBP family intramembrane glutamic endopeptidase [Solirubrobacteraceae bacterium]